MEVGNVDKDVLADLGLEHGVMVKSLGNGKLSRYTDIKEGFIITKVNDRPVNSVKDFNQMIKDKRSGELVILSGTYKQNPKSEYNYAFRK
jgi:S1-C subfamily serine protease